MKWRFQYLVSVMMAAILLAVWGLYKLWPWLLKHHAFKADSAYFLPACVICGAMPFLMGLLLLSHDALSRRRGSKKPREKTPLSDPDHLDL